MCQSRILHNYIAWKKLHTNLGTQFIIGITNTFIKVKILKLCINVLQLNENLK